MSKAQSLLDPRIGLLGSGSFYCFPQGYSKPEFVGTQEEVEAALGLRSPALQAGDRKQLREYTVFVSPKIVTFAGSGTFGEYQQDVFARTRAEAIKIARAERFEAEGRFAVSATYRAKLKR